MNNIHLRSLVDMDALEQWLDAHALDDLATDTETTGLDVFEPDFACGIVCLAHADGTSVTMDGRDVPLVKAALKAARAGGRSLWAHNAGYDAWVLRKTCKVKLTSLLCSAVAARVVWPGRRSGHSLKRLRPTTQTAQDALKARWVEVAAEMGVGVAKGKAWLPQAVRHLPADDPALIAYVVEDTVETARLVEEIKKRLQPGDVEHLQRDLAVDQALRWTGYEGLAVDRDRLREVLEETEAEVEVRIEHFGFRPAFGGNARYAWLAAHGIELPPTKKSKEKLEAAMDDPEMDPDDYPALTPSLNKKDRPLAKVPAEHVDEWAYLCQSIVMENSVPKLHEIYRKSAHDGLAHTTLTVNAAKTGRMSTSNPGTQNISAAVKPSFLAKPGMVLVSADLAHVEPSIMAAASGDPVLTALCSDPEADVYEETAATIWGEQVRERDAAGERTPEAKALRKQGKAPFLGLGYGMGNVTFAVTLGLSPNEDGKAEAASARRATLGMYPVLGQWLEEVKARAKRGEQITTLDGRRLPRRPDIPYVAPNHIIQGTAASIFKTMVLDVHAALAELPPLNGRRARIWLPVHDEIIVECPDDDGYIMAVAKILIRCMTTQINGVPLWAEPQYLGHRWRKDGKPIPVSATEVGAVA